MTQLDKAKRVLSWQQFTKMLSEDNGVNCEEDWYEPTTQWAQVTETNCSDESFLLDDKANFLRWGKEKDLQEGTLSELISEDVSCFNIARLLDSEDKGDLRLSNRQKYDMTETVYTLTAPCDGETKNKLMKQKTCSGIEHEKPTSTKLSKSRSERITKVEKMNIWKRWKKPSGSNTNFDEVPESPVLEDTF